MTIMASERPFGRRTFVKGAGALVVAIGQAAPPGAVHAGARAGRAERVTQRPTPASPRAVSMSSSRTLQAAAVQPA